jgi:hypothetical protein
MKRGRTGRLLESYITADAHVKQRNDPAGPVPVMGGCKPEIGAVSAERVLDSIALVDAACDQHGAKLL